MIETKKYYGKYRSTVLNNYDPEQRGRLQVQALDVNGLLPTTWALPCFPFVGKQMGAYCIPQIGASVWVEFEAGCADHPIWSGGWYDVGGTPALALAGNPASPSMALQTALQNTVLLCDAPGASGITLKTTTGAMISVTDAGILLTTGKGATIVLAANTVTINGGALTVV